MKPCRSERVALSTVLRSAVDVISIAGTRLQRRRGAQARDQLEAVGRRHAHVQADQVEAALAGHRAPRGRRRPRPARSRARRTGAARPPSRGARRGRRRRPGYASSGSLLFAWTPGYQCARHPVVDAFLEGRPVALDGGVVARVAGVLEAAGVVGHRVAVDVERAALDVVGDARGAREIALRDRVGQLGQQARRLAAEGVGEALGQRTHAPARRRPAAAWRRRRPARPRRRRPTRRRARRRGTARRAPPSSRRPSPSCPGAAAARGRARAARRPRGAAPGRAGVRPPAWTGSRPCPRPGTARGRCRWRSR